MEVFMFLSKSSRGIYYLYYTDERNRRQKVSTWARCTSDALQFLTTFSVERDKRRKPITFSAFVLKFIEYAKPNFCSGTIWHYERTRDLYLQLLGDITLDKITPYHWDMYKALRLQHVSPVTVNIELRTLRTLIGKAYRWGMIMNNPLSLLPLCIVPEQYPVYFTHEEFRKYYAAITEQWFKDMVLTAVLTGMRRSEIINLRWRDIDAEKKIIRIQSNPTFRTKAGKKRIMPVHNRLLSIIADAHTHHQDDLVFTCRGKTINGNYATQKFGEILLKTDIQQKGLHFHSLRHTFASWLVQDGVPLYEVQTLMGHSSLAVTEIYAHLQPVQLHTAVNKMIISV